MSIDALRTMTRRNPPTVRRCHRQDRSRGTSLVEFALTAPIGFMFLLSIIGAAIVVTNFIQLTNAARDGARVAAICGSNPQNVIPDGSGGACTATNLSHYITGQLTAIPSRDVSPAIYVCTDAGAGQCSSSSQSCLLGSTPTCNCEVGRMVEVDVQYNQPLYLPLVGQLFGENPDGTRTLYAAAQATCEQ